MNFSVKTLFNKLNNKYILSLGGNGIMSVLLMIIMAVLYHSLSKFDVGIWLFYQTAVVFMDTFRTGFINTAFITFYSGATKERAQEVLGTTWYLAIMITAAFIVIDLPFFFFLKYITDQSIVYFVKYFAINLLFSLPMLIGMCVAQAESNFARLLYLRAMQGGLLLIFIFILIYQHQINVPNLFNANLVSSIVPSVVAILAGWTGLKALPKRTALCKKEMYNFGKFSVASSISASLFGITDTLIVNFMLGPASLAVFGLGKRLLEVVEIPLRSFIATALPAMSQAYNQNKKEEVIEIMKKYVGIITIALIPVLALTFIFAEFAMTLIGGGKYSHSEAPNIFRFCMSFALLSPLDRFLAVTLDVIHKPQVNFIKILVMLVVNLVTDVIGTYIFKNAYGVTVATVFPVLTAVIMSYYYLNENYLKLNLYNTYSLGFNEIKLFLTKTLQRNTEQPVV